MEKVTSVFVLSVLMLVCASMSFGQETDEQRSARLAEFTNNNTKFSALMAHPSVAATFQTQAVNLNCPKPIFFSSGIQGAQIQWLCDSNRNGVADVVGTFWAGTSGRVSALAGFGGYLYAYDGRSSILRFTDTNGDGVIDSEPEEVLAGAAYTERLLPVGVDRLYAEDNGGGRLLRYNVGLNTATVTNRNLPRLGRYVSGTTVANSLRAIFTIDQEESAVKAFSLDSDGNVSSQGYVVFRGSRIASIAVDEASGLLFVLMAGECVYTPRPPMVSSPDNSVSCMAPASPTFCSSGKLAMVNLAFPGKEVVLANGGFMFNVEYASQAHSMLAVDGKVYVTLFAENRFNQYNRSQMIVTYDYSGRGGLEGQQGVIFAGQLKLGNGGFVTSLATFAGGSTPSAQF